MVEGGMEEGKQVKTKGGEQVEAAGRLLKSLAAAR